jgi:cell division topological specificity factor
MLTRKTIFQRLVQVLSREPKSKNMAKSRLKLILVQDRIGADEDVMKTLQVELTALLSKYFELEADNIEMDFQREEHALALVANIPVTGLKVRQPAQEEVSV